MVVLPPQLCEFFRMSQFSQFQCGWWFLKVQFQSRGVPISQGQLRECTEQLCPTPWQQERCTNVELFHDLWNQQSNFPIIYVFSLHLDGNRLERFWVLTYQTALNLHFLVEVKAKENALNSLCVESRNVVQGSVIT